MPTDGPLLHDLVTSAARTAPDRPAVIADDGTSITFAEFDRQIARLAGWAAQRCGRGDRIAVIADNGVDYARLYYAIPRSGAVLALVNQRLSVSEQASLLTAIEPAMIVGDARYIDPLPPTTAPVMSFESPEWQAAQRHSAGDAGASPEDANPDDVAWLLFTSGSTGAPKGVLHTHRSITAAVRGTVEGRSVRSGGVYLLPFPMCHVAGYNVLVHHAAQSTVVPVPAFRPESFVAAVKAYGVTSCSLAPTMLHGLLAHLEQTGADLPTLREIAYGSSAIPADLLSRAMARLDVRFHQGYGMTETGGNVTFLGPDDHRAGARGDAGVLATAGRPHSGVEVRIAGGDVGEIQVRGPQVAAGYWRDPRPVTDGGWLSTGDVGRIDEANRLVVLDRSKDVIITGGENVSSREVEDALSTHGDVDQVAVVGVPDEYWGEAICAVVVARRGTSPAADDLVAHVRAVLTPWKRPRHVLFVDALPTTTNGKVAKDAVRASARDAVRQAGSAESSRRSPMPR
ncbi:AMP-binding protein [Mycolicibacterium sp. GCM10028919]|uniref:AMP-binding protein n=1 Tax=Mycolicibacterium sp. GCM10028919 TaxID=3273401 RepID=UPI00361CB5E2